MEIRFAICLWSWRRGQTTPPQFLSLFGREKLKEIFRTLYLQNIHHDPYKIHFIRGTTLYLSTNQETSQLVLKCGARRVEQFFDAGISEDQINPKPNTKQPHENLKALWVGRLYPLKGLPLALKALKLCKCPVGLTIVGDGPLRNMLPVWIKESGLENRVHWWGGVPWETVKEAYQSHDVLLFTSVRESLGSQVLEAMANSLPIITLNHQGVR